MMDQDMNFGLVLNGRYRVHERIGSGSHGHVYTGVQVGTERKVAIKLLRRESLTDPELEARFQREGLVMCSLKSAHTITTYDFDCTDDGTMYIVMELSDGRPLKKVIEDEAPLPWRRVLGVLTQMCEALAEAHENSIVHRDLKPANILIEKRPANPDFVKILDFGIAKLLHGESLGMDTVPRLTARGQTIGTLRYMSPEQLMGAPLDGRSDIYTLGVLTFELLTRSVPFPEADKAAKLIAAQLREEPPLPSTVHPEGDIPAAVDHMVMRMLGKEPDERVGSALELASICESILAMDESELARGLRLPSAPPVAGDRARSRGVSSAGTFDGDAEGQDDDDDDAVTRLRAATAPPTQITRSATHPEDAGARSLQPIIIATVAVAVAVAAGLTTWAVLW